MRGRRRLIYCRAIRLSSSPLQFCRGQNWLDGGGRRLIYSRASRLLCSPLWFCEGKTGLGTVRSGLQLVYRRAIRHCAVRSSFAEGKAESDCGGIQSKYRSLIGWRKRYRATGVIKIKIRRPVNKKNMTCSTASNGSMCSKSHK